MQDSSMPVPSRRARYSGNERPAWRMNHTGVWDTGSPRTALRNALSLRSLGSAISGPASQVASPVHTAGAPARSAGAACRGTDPVGVSYGGSMVARQETHQGSGAAGEPPEFSAAVAAMREATLRPEIFCEEMPAP